jgi:hypothetical protein
MIEERLTVCERVIFSKLRIFKGSGSDTDALVPVIGAAFFLHVKKHGKKDALHSNT